MNESWTKSIISCWKALGIKLNSGTTVNAIAEIEKEIGINFPSDFKELYVEMNGFSDRDWTPTMFSLWPLERILNEYSHAGKYGFVGFCDYLINSHCLGFVKNQKGVFKEYGEGEPMLIAQSFSEAVHLVNIDARIIY
jgi:SMI1/KNR4 family protein SUKH-1